MAGSIHHVARHALETSRAERNLSKFGFEGVPVQRMLGGGTKHTMHRLFMEGAARYRNMQSRFGSMLLLPILGKGTQFVCYSLFLWIPPRCGFTDHINVCMRGWFPMGVCVVPAFLFSRSCSSAGFYGVQCRNFKLRFTAQLASGFGSFAL